MHPAFSVIVFTTLAGAAQGALVALAVATLAGAALHRGFVALVLGVALGMLVVALGASFLHLGRPERAWRAIAMWRTSWLSREVIVLPAFIATVGLWLALHLAGGAGALRFTVLPVAVIALALLLWWCTAMIYACLKFIQEWAHPLTLANYLLIGLASGVVLYAALAVASSLAAHAFAAALWGLALTFVALAVRLASLVRNARLRPRSTPQSATGLRGTVVQRSMGMTGGAFNTREFMHGKAPGFVGRMRLLAIVFGFLLPAALVALALGSGQGVWLVLAVPVQYAGLLAERWLFFAQARHPQNLYYQTVS